MKFKLNSVQTIQKRGSQFQIELNVPELESESSYRNELTYAKQVLNQDSKNKNTRPGLEQAK